MVEIQRAIFPHGDNGLLGNAQSVSPAAGVQSPYDFWLGVTAARHHQKLRVIREQ